jgi:hypothetical protein
MPYQKNQPAQAQPQDAINFSRFGFFFRQPWKALVIYLLKDLG